MKSINIDQMCDLMNFSVIIKDVDGNIIKINKYTADRLGIKQEDAVHLSTEEIVKDSFKEIYENDKRVIKTKKPLYGVTHKLMQDGQERWIKVDRIPFLDDNGEVTRIFIMIHDTTKQVKTEQEALKLQLLADKGVYLTEIVHNLKNPLSAAIGFSRLAKKMFGDNDLFNKIDHAHQNLLSIITDILNVKNNSFSSDYKLESIEFMIDDVVDMVRMNKDKRIKDYLKIDIDVYDTAQINPTHLKQVITNLVNNSIEELHGKEERKIEITARQIGKKIAISIGDNGGGIPQDKLASIFEAQYSTKTNSDSDYGTGLGLSFNKRMLELYNGSISVESQEGEGTVFTFFLPVAA